MTQSLRFLSEVNNYLDKIDESGSFQPERLEKLEDYKTEMLEMGFNAPFSALMAATKDELDEATAEELQDLRKQIQEVRYVAALKRFSLNRVRVAVASHKLAGAMRDFGTPERIALLPMGGSYLKTLFERGGEPAVEAYRKLIGLFEQRRFSIQGASAVISVVQDGKDVERTLELEAGADAKETVKKLFGSGAKVKSVVLKKKTRGLIKNHSTKVALFTMAALEGANAARVESNMDEAGDAQAQHYNSILAKHGIVSDAVLIESEKFENVKNEMASAGFMNKVKGEWKMEEELITKLHARRAHRRRLAMGKADSIVYSLMQWYYICFNVDGRKGYGAMPSVLAEPGEEHLSVMADLAPPHYPVTHPPRVVAAKMKMEAHAPPLPPKIWGPAFVCVRANVEAAWAAEEFQVDEKELASAIPLLKSLMDKPSGRASGFMAELKKEKKKA